MLFKMFHALLLFFIISRLSSARKCNLDDELPCLTSNDCIHKLQWCDKNFDCKDGSDEYFCNADSCPEALYRCENRRCIPSSARCDGFNNCGDGSDEICESRVDYTVDLPSMSNPDFDLPFTLKDPIFANPLTNAARYLIKEGRLSNFMPRTIVALTFVEKYGKISSNWTSSMKKELNLKIVLNLIQSNMKPDMGDLAHYINALYATCQDPRRFQGIDLVRLLRTQVDSTEKLDLPFVLLTLCISEETKSEDSISLLSMYDRMDGDRIGSKALVMMALACISKSSRSISRSVQRKLQDFKQDANSTIRNADVYTKSLYIQALNAWDYRIPTDLWSHQLQDSSFGDLLATYYAIPALLKTSLLDLKCASSKYEEVQMSIQLPHNDSDTKKITYSLWIDKGTYFNAHSMIITLDGNKTLYDVMKMAEAKSSIFSFSYESSIDGKKIYRLAAIPNDAETGMAWNLYRGKENSVSIYSKENLFKQNLGLDKIYPRAEEHFIFWFEHSFA